MPNYDWTCQICDTAVASGNDECTKCMSPASMNAQEIEERQFRWKMENNNPHRKPYECIKCKGTRYEYGQIRASGGGLSAIFEIENKKFVHITCIFCGYTELYKKKSSMGMSVLDFLIN